MLSSSNKMDHAAMITSRVETEATESCGVNVLEHPTPGISASGSRIMSICLSEQLT